MDYKRMLIEKESPEEYGYNNIKYNLSESSVTDAVLGDVLGDASLSQLVLLYTVHYGDEGLRREILSLYGDNHGLTIDDVIVTPGAAAALFIVHTAILKRESHIVVQFPNYGTNIATPEAIGSEITKVHTTFENGYCAKAEDFLAVVKANTRLVSVTTPHNPSGMQQLGLVKSLSSNLFSAERSSSSPPFLLVDETYRQFSDSVTDPIAASLHERIISISSMSKAFGLPGVRIGWLITKNAALKELFLAAKEQIFITNSVLDEQVARIFLERRAALVPAIRQRTAENLAILKDWMKQHDDMLEWVEPDGSSCTCFPRFKSSFNIDLPKFYKLLLEKYFTWVGPGRWFGLDDRNMRIGYGYPSSDCMRQGLQNLAQAAMESAN